MDLTTEAAEPEPKIIKSFEQKNPMKLPISNDIGFIIGHQKDPY